MATTQEQNERLTQVGPGTPMGNLLRRYWQPIAVAVELDADAGQARARSRRRPHALPLPKPATTASSARSARTAACRWSSACPTDGGLRCPYHGWVFDATGQCIEQPFEDRVNPEARYKDRIKITAYPVQELGGMLFAYLGPQPAPLLPRWDLLVRDDLDRAVEICRLPCNLLQCMDNSADPVHFEFLHAALRQLPNSNRLGKPPAYVSRPSTSRSRSTCSSTAS